MVQSTSAMYHSTALHNPCLYLQPSLLYSMSLSINMHTHAHTHTHAQTQVIMHWLQVSSQLGRYTVVSLFLQECCGHLHNDTLLALFTPLQYIQVANSILSTGYIQYSSEYGISTRNIHPYQSKLIV